MKKERVSVRDLVSFNSSKGSLGGGLLTSSRAVAGTKEHKRIQDSRGEEYHREYSLTTFVERGNISLEIYGRADGIYYKMSPPVIEEIKTTTSDGVSEEHLNQVKLYAYLYLIERSLLGDDLKKVNIKLLYIDISDKSERVIKESLTKDELSDFFNSQVEPYLNYLENRSQWVLKRDDSLKELKFPFNRFRSGQREFSIGVFRAIRDGETLFARAPTGTGKSIATLFPALKSMAEGGCEKVFYLTAKTVGRITARDTLNLLREAGAAIRSVVITAKEKICIHSEFNCNPDICPYARDYYQKLSYAIEDMLNESDFYEDNLKGFGQKHTLCPFELSLDISNLCDVIVCDYNYVFDIKVQLKRFFDRGKREFALLIDEAHNLPDRLKSSYTSEIIREDIPPVINIIKSLSNLSRERLERVNNLLLEYNKNNKDPYTVLDEVPIELIRALRGFVNIVEAELITKDFQGKNLLLDLYFNSLFFIKLSELYTEGHKFLILNHGGLGISVKILCNDPSFLFTKMLLKSKSHIFFSATLTPLNFYTSLLLDDREFSSVNIPSPYVLEHLNLIIRSDIKTTYRERGRYYQEVADTIMDIANSKKGNYMVFFPSYAYMEEVKKLINTPVHIQRNSMSEDERREYIDAFNKEDNILSFAIMGGVFGEGIDLVGDRLIGVIIVGVGLPGISLEGDLMRSYYNSKGINGYNYAYTFPGFNKVMQAVGRVIRREEDKGVAVLIDSRFNSPLYQNLFPYEWNHFKISNSREDMKRRVHTFWNNMK